WTPRDFSVVSVSLIMKAADTLRSLAAPPIVPVTITARITSTWRSVIMCEGSGDELAGYYHLQSARRAAGAKFSGGPEIDDQAPSRDPAITFLAAVSARCARAFASTVFASSVVGTSILTVISAGMARVSETRSMPPSPGNIRSWRAAWIIASVVVGRSAGASHICQ